MRVEKVRIYTARDRWISGRPRERNRDFRVDAIPGCCVELESEDGWKPTGKVSVWCDAGRPFCDEHNNDDVLGHQCCKPLRNINWDGLYLSIRPDVARYLAERLLQAAYDAEMMLATYKNKAGV